MEELFHLSQHFTCKNFEHDIKNLYMLRFINIFITDHLNNQLHINQFFLIKYVS